MYAGRKNNYYYYALKKETRTNEVKSKKTEKENC